MTNKEELLANVDVKTFQLVIANTTRNNILPQVANKVASLLALDYAHRLNSQPKISDYLELISTRLTNYLGYKVVTDDDFSIAMSLFTVAITPEIDQGRDKDSQEQSIDAAIDAAILEHFSDLSPEEISMMKDILKSLMQDKSLQEVIEFITTDPAFAKEMVRVAISEKKQKQELENFIHSHINNLIQQQKQIKQAKSNIKSITSKAFMTSSIVAAASIGLLTGGIMLPALAIPAIVATLPAFSKVSDKITKKVIDGNDSIKKINQDITNSKNEIITLVQSKEKVASHTVENTKSINKSQAIEITKSRLANKDQHQQKASSKIVEQRKQKALSQKKEKGRIR